MIVLTLLFLILKSEAENDDWGRVDDITYEIRGRLEKTSIERLKDLVRQTYSEPYKLSHKRAILEETLEKNKPALKFWIDNKMLNCEHIDIAYCDRWVCFKMHFTDKDRHYLFLTVMARPRKKSEIVELRERDWGKLKLLEYEIQANGFSEGDAYYIALLVKQIYNEPFTLETKRDHLQAVLEKNLEDLDFWIDNKVLNCKDDQAYCNRWLMFKLQFETRRYIYLTIMARRK